MSNQNPHQPTHDPDRTIYVPTPGGKRVRPRMSEAPSMPSAPVPRDVPRAMMMATTPGHGLNSLVQAANPLLDMVLPLRSMSASPDIKELRERLVRAVRAFEEKARAAQIGVETIAAARYALCALLDEAISHTPWGAGGVWASHSMLVTFHNEAWGGEKFFLVLQRLSRDPQANLHALELMYLCLALGFEGRYRIADNGRNQLEALRERLLLLIRQQRGAPETELSPHWQAASVAAPSLLRGLPVWVMAATAGALLLVLHLWLGYRLNRASDPVFASLAQIQLAAPDRTAAAPMPTPNSTQPPGQLSLFLAPEIRQGLVSVSESPDRTAITLHGDGVFASGSAEIAPSFIPLMERIGDALKTVPGRVLVIGHTDDTRPRISTRFPSNWELSRARAAAVVALLAQRAAPVARYRAEGRGDAEPLATNDSPANRARNRRVDIVVLAPTSAP